MDIMRVPLHQIHLKSDLVSGPVVVGERPTLPVKGYLLFSAMIWLVARFSWTFRLLVT